MRRQKAMTMRAVPTERTMSRMKLGWWALSHLPTSGSSGRRRKWRTSYNLVFRRRTGRWWWQRWWRQWHT